MRKARRAAARRGRRLRIMFADEARFGRMNRPPVLGSQAARARGRRQLIREYIYLYGAVSPKDGTCVFLIMPTANTECFQIFLNMLAEVCSFAHSAVCRRCRQSYQRRPCDSRQHHALVSPAYSPELNPQENIWDEIREKIFKNYALKSMDAVRAKLRRAILYMERNPKLIRSIS